MDEERDDLMAENAAEEAAAESEDSAAQAEDVARQEDIEPEDEGVADPDLEEAAEEAAAESEDSAAQAGDEARQEDVEQEAEDAADPDMEEAAEQAAAESEDSAAQAGDEARQEDVEQEAEGAADLDMEQAAEAPEIADERDEVTEAAPQMTLAHEEEVEEMSEAEAPDTAVEAGEPDIEDRQSPAVEEKLEAMEAEAEAAEPTDEPQEEPDDGRAWYVVHCYSGYENKVRHNLEQRIESMGMKDQIFDVVVPTEEEIEVKEGKRRTVERRVFPGYILVNMIMGEEPWYVVRNTPGVTSFVGQGNEPLPLRPEEVSQIIKRMEADAPRIKVTFRSGERVRIIDGPFNDFRGTVSEIDMERAKVRVMVNFFGRETPVELDFLQVEKA